MKKICKKICENDTGASPPLITTVSLVFRDEDVTLFRCTLHWLGADADAHWGVPPKHGFRDEDVTLFRCTLPRAKSGLDQDF